MPYDEWRRYCCQAVLQPEDYGCMRGPGYDNPVTLGVSFTANNWWNIPKNGLVPAENYNGVAAEIVVVQLYDKWYLNVNASGSAQSGLTRIANPIMAGPSSIGLNTPQPLIGLRDMM